MADQKEVLLTAEDEGKEIHLQRDQVLLIALEANPSTGYRWEVAEIDPPILELTDDGYQPDAEAAMGVGAAGTQRLTFEPVDLGETEVVLAYRRPWETAVDPANTFAIEIAIG